MKLAKSRFIKRMIYWKVFGYHFLKKKDAAEYMFIFSNGYELYGEQTAFLDFLDYLREDFKNCKLGIHLYDAMQRKDTIKFLSEYRNKFDIILTFNRYDEIEHGLEYYGPVSESGIVEPQGDGEDSDVFYAGAAGWARYDLILDTFRWLSDQGKKCIFFVPVGDASIRKEYFQRLCKCLEIQADYAEEICLAYKNSKFYFNRYLAYAWTLPYIHKTKAILEIVILPEGRASCTNRLAQAMAYGKKLLTNSEITKEEPYYSKNSICVFSKPEEIDLTFFDRDFEKPKRDFSGIYMLKYMEYKTFGNLYDPKTKSYLPNFVI